MASAGAPSLAQRGAPFFEAYDVLDDGVIDNQAAGGGKLLYYGLEPLTAPGSFWTAASGAPAPVTLANGVRAWNLLAGASVVSKGCGTQWGTPLQKALGSVAGAVPNYRRYRTTAVIWRDVLTGGARLSFSVNMQGDGRSLADFTNIFGIEVCSVLGTYGGNWHVRKRLVSLGAITTYADSNLSPLVPRRIVFDYLEGLVRTLTVRVDGLQIYSEQGDGLLAFDPPGVAKVYGPGVALTAGAGSNGYVRDVAYRMEYLADPWAGL